jgi:uncharacterized protein YndB with AHSA1/START domain
MKSNFFNFSVDKENSKVIVEREFAAPQTNVWAAWTQPELLDQWWAPKPWKSETKEMNFIEGGRRLYAMIGPNGEEHWSLSDFLTIDAENNFTTLNAFSDSDGKINEDFPRSNWNVTFSEANDTTMVRVEIRHQKLADLEKYIEMGFKEGFTMALGNLDELLEA